MEILKITVTPKGRPISFPFNCQPIKPEMIEPVDQFVKEKNGNTDSNKSDNNTKQ